MIYYCIVESEQIAQKAIDLKLGDHREGKFVYYHANDMYNRELKRKQIKALEMVKHNFNVKLI